METSNEPPFHTVGQESPIQAKQPVLRGLTTSSAFRWMEKPRGICRTSGMYSFYGMFHITDRYFEAVSSSRAARPPGWAAVCAFSVTKGLGTQS